MTGTKAWGDRYSTDLTTCWKTMPSSLGLEDRINILNWARDFAEVKKAGDFLQRRAAKVLEDADLKKKLALCDEFVTDHLGQDFAEFGYAPWNALIAQFFPEDDAEEEEEPEEPEDEEETVVLVTKGKAKAKTTGPPETVASVTTRGNTKAKSTTQLAGSAGVRPTLKTSMGPPADPVKNKSKAAVPEGSEGEGCARCVKAGKECVMLNATRCVRCADLKQKCPLGPVAEVVPPPSGPSTRAKRERKDSAVAVSAPPVAGGSGVSRSASRESSASDKRQRIDTWTAIRGSPAPSGSSGVSSNYELSRRPSMDELRARRERDDEAMLEEQLSKLQIAAELAIGAYEGIRKVYRERFGREWSGHRGKTA